MRVLYQLDKLKPLSYAKSVTNKSSYILPAILTLLVILLLSLAIYRYGRFWEKKSPAPSTQPPADQTMKINSDLLEKADSDSRQFLNQNLQPKFKPASFEINPLKNDKSDLKDPNRFIVTWSSAGLPGTSSVRYSSDHILEDRTISITIATAGAQLTPTTAAKLTSQYFTLPPKSSWKCDYTVTLCESFWTDERLVKKGIGVLSPASSQQSQVFLCEFYPQSPMYSWKSCSIHKANSGWE